jgi:hypothetical protein
MDVLRQPVAADRNGFGLFPRIRRLADLPLIATVCDRWAP